MTVGDLDSLIDELVERLGDTLAPCVHLAFTGETGEC